MNFHRQNRVQDVVGNALLLENVAHAPLQEIQDLLAHLLVLRFRRKVLLCQLHQMAQGIIQLMIQQNFHQTLSLSPQGKGIARACGDDIDGKATHNGIQFVGDRQKGSQAGRGRGIL